MPNYPNAPSYPTPNYDAFGQTIGNLPNAWRQGQQDQMQLDRNRAVTDVAKGGVPMNPDGTVNWSAWLQSMARAGDPGAAAQYGPLVQDQAWQKQAASNPSPFAGASYPSASNTGDVPPASAGRATASAPPSSGYQPKPSAAPNNASFGNITGVQTAGADNIDGIVGQALPYDFSPITRAQVTDNLAKALKVQPGQKLTPEQAARAQKLISGYAQRKGVTQTAGLNGDARGMRNNNPGNLEANNWTAGLPGYVGSDGRFAKFDNPQDGAAALDRNLQGYGRKGINTPLAIASTWAPGSERGNNPGAYGSAIAQALNVGPNDPVDLSDPGTRGKIGQAIAFVENGPGKATAPASQAITQAMQGSGAPRQGGRTIFPQVPLPGGATDPGQAVYQLDGEIYKRESSPNPYIRNSAGALRDLREQIIRDYAPREVRPGQSFVDAKGNTVYQAPAANSGAAADIASAIESGEQAPVLTGLYGASAGVRQRLAKDGFDLGRAQLQWQAAQKQVASLNGPQQIRFKGLADSVVNTIEEVRGLAEQMQLSGVPMLNAAELQAYVQTQGNSPSGQLATQYLTAVGTLKEEFANLANGGYAPTEPAWHLADQQINGNYGVKQLNSSLDEIQRLIKYRLNAMPGMSAVGPGSANPYMPGSGQAQQPQAAPSQSSASRPSVSGNLPAGTYRYDPNTGKLEPVK
jgi:hypothetical protein